MNDLSFLIIVIGLVRVNLECLLAQHPRTTVALINDTVEISCYHVSPGQLPSPQLRINDAIVSEKTALNPGVFWEQLKENNSIVGFAVNITATIENNYTSIQCIFSCASKTGFVIAVDCK